MPWDVSTFWAFGSIFVPSPWTNSTPCDSKVFAKGNTTSMALRLPNGIQMREGLNWNRSDFDTTVTSTSWPSSCFTLSAAVRPAKFPPSTSTFLFAMYLPPSPRLPSYVGQRARGEEGLAERRGVLMWTLAQLDRVHPKAPPAPGTRHWIGPQRPRGHSVTVNGRIMSLSSCSTMWQW